MKILVFGSRDSQDIERFSRVMNAIHKRFGLTHVIHGACSLKKRTGYDWIADEWAKANGVQPVACEALWDYYRDRGNVKSAGPIRNDLMLALQPELALHCPGGTGTADMLRRVKVYAALSRRFKLFDLTATVHAVTPVAAHARGEVQS